jgi:hypothetical protein
MRNPAKGMPAASSVVQAGAGVASARGWEIGHNTRGWEIGFAGRGWEIGFAGRGWEIGFGAA